MIKIGSTNLLRKRTNKIHPRTKKAHFNTVVGLIVKGGGILISLLLVPLTIDYLSKDTYGTWLTISSIVTMLTFLDIGIGNGLRNKFSEAVTKNDIMLARAYVSTAYLAFGLIQLFFILLFLLIFRYIPWQIVFNTSTDIQQLRLIVLITIVAMAIKLVLDILSYILLAIQQSGLVSLINLSSNVIVLIGTYCLTHFASKNLVYLASVTVISPVIVLLISGLILYRKQLKVYRPSFRLASFTHVKSLLSLGYKFFFIQIAVVVLFYTDNIIVAQLFGPSEVTTYNIAFRYFSAINTLFAIAITPYWSAFTEAAVKRDEKWMKDSYLYLQKIWLILIVAIVFMIAASGVIYKTWLGDRVSVPLVLTISMGIFTIINCWNSIVAAVVNGLGKVRIQLYYALSSAIINVPLAILLSKKFNIGSTSVILATIICLLIGSFLVGIQAKKLVSGTATGMWNQ